MVTIDKRLVPIVCVVILYLVISAGYAQPVYQKLLPQTPQAQSLYVFDLRHDIPEDILNYELSDDPQLRLYGSDLQWDTKEALFVNFVLQGLINRERTDKIYFIHTPIEKGWRQGHNLYYPADYRALYDGLIPVPFTFPLENPGVYYSSDNRNCPYIEEGYDCQSLMTDEPYPVLFHLLRHYRDYVGHELGGVVLIPDMNTYPDPEDPDDDYLYDWDDIFFTAAVTVCAAENAIPITPSLAAVLEACGFDSEPWWDHVIADLSDTENPAVGESNDNLSPATRVYNWLNERYFTYQTCRDMIGIYSFELHWDRSIHGGDIQFPTCFDYFVANNVFVISYDKFNTFIEDKDYPYGTPAIGMKQDDSRFPDEYVFDLCSVPNLSVTCSLPCDEVDIIPPCPLQIPDHIDPNDAYVGFYVTDGDHLDYSGIFFYHWIRQFAEVSPSGSRVIPISWSFNAQWLDLFPHYVGWMSRMSRGLNHELVANTWYLNVPYYDMNRYHHYLDQANGLFQTINLHDTHKYYDYHLAHIFNNYHDYSFIHGYANNRYIRDNVMKAASSDNVLLHPYGKSGSYVKDRIDDTTLECVYPLIYDHAGLPSFALIIAGDGRWSGDPIAEVTEAVRELESPVIIHSISVNGRTYHAADAITGGNAMTDASGISFNTRGGYIQWNNIEGGENYSDLQVSYTIVPCIDCDTPDDDRFAMTMLMVNGRYFNGSFKLEPPDIPGEPAVTSHRVMLENNSLNSIRLQFRRFHWMRASELAETYRKWQEDSGYFPIGEYEDTFDCLGWNVSLRHNNFSIPYKKTCFEFYGNFIDFSFELPLDSNIEGSIRFDNQPLQDFPEEQDSECFSRMWNHDGIHNVEIEVNRIIKIDSFSILRDSLFLPEPMLWDDRNLMIRYSGDEWRITNTTERNAYKGSYHNLYSYDRFCYGSFGFDIENDAFLIIASRSPGAGKADIYIDGRYEGVIDYEDSIEQSRTVVYDKSDLGPGRHHIEVITSDFYPINLDAVCVLDSSINKAIFPEPCDQATEAVPDGSLKWLSKSRSFSYNIYFSDDPVITPDELLASQTRMTYETGFLSPLTTYFWRVDVVMPDGSIVEGDTWRFTTKTPNPPAKPSRPGAKYKDSSIQLSWHYEPVDIPVDYVIIERSISSDSDYEQIGISFTENRLVDSNVEPDTLYYYRITVVDQWPNQSEASDSILISTTALSRSPGALQS